MKRLLIILFAALLIFSGCSSNINDDRPVGNENNEPKNIDTINDNNGTENKNEEIEDDQGLEDGSADSSDEANETNETNETDKKNESEETGDTNDTNDSNEEITDQTETEKLPEDTVTEEVEKKSTRDQEEIIVENAIKVEGLAENELILTVDDLKAMKDIIYEADFYSLNSFGTTGYTHFKGVKLWELLEKALIKPEASKVLIIAQDGYSMEFTIEQVQMEYMDETNPDNKYPMIIAWEENGQEYTTDRGNPYKLVVGQKEPGDVNKPQWVSNIDVIIIE